MSLLVAGYLRTSSTTNVEGDSSIRQELAIKKYAELNHMQIGNWAYDEGVSGKDMPLERKGFSQLAEWCVKNNCDTILTENASRFSRDVIVQEVTLLKLKEIPLNVIPVDSPDYYKDDSPSITMIRQILACVSGFERSSLVQKLKSARYRARVKSGNFTLTGNPKCEGRKSLREKYGEIRYQKFINNVLTLRQTGLSYAKIAGEIAKKGYVQPTSGNPFDAGQVRRFIIDNLE